MKLLETPTPAPCELGFEKEENKGADGGVEAKGVTGVDDCSAYCLLQGEDCLAFDIGKGDESCWIFDDAVKAANTAERDDADHYTKVEICGKLSIILSILINTVWQCQMMTCSVNSVCGLYLAMENLNLLIQKIDYVLA